MDAMEQVDSLSQLLPFLPWWIPFLLPPAWLLFTALVTFAFGFATLLVFGGLWLPGKPASAIDRAAWAYWGQVLLLPSRIAVPCVGVVRVDEFVGPFTAPAWLMVVLTIAGSELASLILRRLVRRRHGSLWDETIPSRYGVLFASIAVPC